MVLSSQHMNERSYEFDPLGDRGSEELYQVCCSIIKLIPSPFGLAKRMWSRDCFNLQLIIKIIRDYGQSECTIVAEETLKYSNGEETQQTGPSR
jgi:hypothetical protein